MLNDNERNFLQSSWRLAAPIAETVGDLFYKKLFELEPSYQKLFPDDMVAQKRKLIRMLNFIVKSLDWFENEWTDDVDPTDDLFLIVLAMGRRHEDLYHIPHEAYETVSEALIWTLGYSLGDAFTDEVRGAWTKLYKLLSQIMIAGAKAQFSDKVKPAPVFKDGN